MHSVFCLTQNTMDVPTETTWLTPKELDVLERLTIAKRRADWMLGRWTAKQALLRYLGLDASDIGRLAVLAASDGAPQATLDGKPCRLVVSISHSGERAFCAVADNDVAMGCDIEYVEARDEVFAQTFLTTNERQWADAMPDAIQPLAVTLIWSAKESVLKATRVGLTVDTWSIDVERTSPLVPNGWQPLHARQVAGGKAFCGWWRCDDGFVLTLAADESARRPIELEPVVV